eukprot:CAMPEP_0204174256 /NCGR_PEP_ID=MMETSP0361-20130328/45724_1 /ASSEMBLY_ACC=CAM_ASM_000343 /TAXON_ID=268821 /ORGANISM="Scrippsiella Hangoei, Strain SHTV-5" /LENGTH=318 /DNA_ID=CAMNT_0051132697 /DNA_START=94 /DNA_END=1050 /DNA_ORIENTATION=-
MTRLLALKGHADAADPSAATASIQALPTRCHFPPHHREAVSRRRRPDLDKACPSEQVVDSCASPDNVTMATGSASQSMHSNEHPPPTNERPEATDSTSANPPLTANAKAKCSRLPSPVAIRIFKEPHVTLAANGLEVEDVFESGAHGGLNPLTAGLNELDLIELIRGHQGRFLASGTLYGSNSVRVAVDLSVKIHRHAASKGSLEASFRLGDARSRRRMRRHNIRRRRCGLVRGRFIPCNLDNCRNRRVQPKLFRCLLLRGGRACGQAEELPRRASLIQKVVEASDDRGLFLFVAEDGGDEVHRPHQPDELLQLLGGA